MLSVERKRIVIVGGTSAIAEHCARLWLTGQEADLLLLCRDIGKGELVAADLRVRSPASNVVVRAADFLDPAAVAAAVDASCARGVPDLVLVAHGVLPDQGVCESALATNAAALAVNGISPVLFAEAFAGRMQRAGRGVLAVIGSVAGERGRKSNYVYGAAKGLVERYVQGLQHRLADSGVQVVLIKPGPTDTPMTSSFKQAGRPLAPVADVAAVIVSGIARGRPVVYAPAKWALVMLVIRNLPRWVFNRMDI